MSGVLAWLVGFLDGTTGKYHFRQTHHRPSHFASGHWTYGGVESAGFKPWWGFRSTQVVK